MNPVRLLDDVNEAKFRDRMKDVDLAKEKEKTKYHGGPEALWGKRADTLTKQTVKLDFANDEPKQAKAGFRKKRHNAPQPKLKRKMWYGDPGI